MDNAIAPGKIYNYVWKVPERAGPGPNDTDCLTWGYYSDVNPVRDTNTGLVGPLVICRKVNHERLTKINNEKHGRGQDKELSLQYVSVRNIWGLDRTRGQSLLFDSQSRLLNFYFIIVSPHKGYQGLTLLPTTS